MASHQKIAERDYILMTFRRDDSHSLNIDSFRRKLYFTQITIYIILLYCHLITTSVHILKTFAFFSIALNRSYFSYKYHLYN